MTSTTDLNVYASLSERAVALSADDDLIFTSADFPKTLPDHTVFDGFAIDTGFRRSMGWAGEGDMPFEIVDQSPGFNAVADREGYRRIGLWLMHLLLSDRDWAGLTLTHPESHVQVFYARIARPALRDHKLVQTAPITFASYEYWPQEVWRHPFADAAMAPVHRVAEQDRPFFAFGWSDDADRMRFDPAKADQLILEATPEGIAAMACVLMDMAHETLGREEINMEPPLIGFAGTRPRSLEARFWLPDAICFAAPDVASVRIPQRG
ncbi:hypothetical protein A8B78_14510 [Jannaschia sp. EhC01]|nr:hypothetical protein A8B78_14510 [Jannaschia sp. EhC01]